MKVVAIITWTHNPFDEDYWASCLRENLTSSSYGEGLETGREYAQEPRQFLTRQVDQKEEKDLLGVGQAQVWSDASVARQPAFHVASYAALLLAAIKTYGMNTTAAAGRLPLWRLRKPPSRLSAAHLIANLRQDIETLETVQSGRSRRKKGLVFLADALCNRFGKKFPITTRAILSSAWT